MSNPGKLCFSFVPNNDAKYVSVGNCSQTTKEQANTISINQTKKNRFFRVLVVQFDNKRVKSHQAKTNTESCNNEGPICITYKT